LSFRTLSLITSEIQVDGEYDGTTCSVYAQLSDAGHARDAFRAAVERATGVGVARGGRDEAVRKLPRAGVGRTLGCRLTVALEGGSVARGVPLKKSG